MYDILKTRSINRLCYKKCSIDKNSWACTVISILDKRYIKVSTVFDFSPSPRVHYIEPPHWVTPTRRSLYDLRFSFHGSAGFVIRKMWFLPVISDVENLTNRYGKTFEIENYRCKFVRLVVYCQNVISVQLCFMTIRSYT